VTLSTDSRSARAECGRSRFAHHAGLGCLATPDAISLNSAPLVAFWWAIAPI